MTARITAEPIDVAALLADVRGAEHGAALLFTGTVRNRNEGRPVSGLRYDAYATMAQDVLGEIVAEAAARWGPATIAAVHRTGELGVGDISVAIAVATPHRVSAYEASRYVIEELKQRLPVWKHEYYADADGRWLDGHTPAAASGPARTRPADG